MGNKLNRYVTSGYLQAAQKLRGEKHRRRIVVYVESYADVFFWRALLSDLETNEAYFEVMLPSQTTLTKGKKCALLNALEQGLGPNLIACVDADYDYMLDGNGRTSAIMKASVCVERVGLSLWTLPRFFHGRLCRDNIFA